MIFPPSHGDGAGAVQRNSVLSRVTAEGSSRSSCSVEGKAGLLLHTTETTLIMMCVGSVVSDLGIHNDALLHPSLGYGYRWVVC